MEYKDALLKAWQELDSLTQEKKHSVKLLADEYDIDLEKKSVFSVSCNVPAPGHASILILHYLKQKLKGLPEVKGEWIAFQEMVGGQGYYPVFKNRVIKRIARKYGEKPEALLELLERFKAKKVQLADISVVLEVFDNVPVLIELWRADEEFGLSADVLFDKSITDIFCTEDTVVLAELIASNI